MSHQTARNRIRAGHRTVSSIHFQPFSTRLILATLSVLSFGCCTSVCNAGDLPSALTSRLQKFQDQSGITVVYPRGDKVPSSSTYIAGAVSAGTSLTCNGAAVRLSADGFFAHVVPLKPGTNSFILQSQPSGASREIKIDRESPQPPISINTCIINPSSCHPSADKGVSTGDVIEFSAHATPGGDLDVTVGKHKIAMHQTAASPPSSGKHRARAHAVASHVNRGLDVAYGKVYQRSSAAPSDLYVASYKVQPDDIWNRAKIKFSLTVGGRSTSVLSKGSLTTVQQPMFAETTHDKTVVRTGPGLGRVTPLPAGVRVVIDGWQDDSMRCIYAPNHHYWIKRDDLLVEEHGQTDAAPDSVARTINIANDEYGAAIKIPLSQKLPFLIEQQLRPNKLILHVFGVTADTDWITPSANTDGSHSVENVSCKQTGDGIYEVAVQLRGGRQWGFQGSYEDNNLVLHVKSAPKLGVHPTALKGLTICVDPGHGGSEPGAIGCSGVREAEINLGIGIKVARLLQDAGARVILTRNDDRTVSLEERVNIAEAAKADVLLSVHNNSLPDGRDPNTEHGSSTYWYHPQSIQLAHLIKDRLVKRGGFPDFGSRFQNLALTRPSNMLAVLVEVGFVINPEEYAELISESGQSKEAQGIVDGLIDYLNPPRPPGKQN